MQWLLWAVDTVLLSLCNIVVLCLVAPILSFRFFQTPSDWVLAATLLFTPFWFAAGDPLEYADAKWTLERLQTAARYKRAASRFLACGMAIVAVIKLGHGFNFANVAMAMVWALFACGCLYFADVDERERLRLVQGKTISNLGVCYGVRGWLARRYDVALLCRLVYALALVLRLFMRLFIECCRYGGWPYVYSVMRSFFRYFRASSNGDRSSGRPSGSRNSHARDHCGAADAKKKKRGV
jgi:hypothetical protein